jgi:hypothetical protein
MIAGIMLALFRFVSFRFVSLKVMQTTARGPARLLLSALNVRRIRTEPLAVVCITFQSFI